jgi:hypothetical protein
MIVITDEELKHLEEHFGPDVRQMGPWHSDGVFGYSAVAISTLEQAAQGVGDATLTDALKRLKSNPERIEPFIEIVETFGPDFVEKIVVTYRDQSFSHYDRSKWRWGSQ